MPAQPPSAAAQPRVLIVDDQLVNIRLLERKLSSQNLTVLSALSGREALGTVQSDKPDVILLDIMMPEMDGLEVCRQLKANPQTADIPVIFITARSSREGKIEGLKYGAADYLTKPIDLEETLARVNTQIRIRQNHQENLRLSAQLAETQRRQTMMHLTEGIAHNLNNLLGIASGYLGMLRSARDDADKFTNFSKRMEEALRRMAKITHELTTIGQFEKLETADFPLNRLLQHAIERFRDGIGHPVAVDLINPLPAAFTLVTNPELLAGSVERLLTNAWESYSRTDSPAGGRPVLLRVEPFSRDNLPWLRLIVEDKGCGIPASIVDHVFDPFVSTQTAVGRGMGLTIARHSVISLGGTIELQSNLPAGTRAVICLPTAQPATAAD
jgi:two-component system, sensor histidine kinase and response regulator